MIFENPNIFLRVEIKLEQTEEAVSKCSIMFAVSYERQLLDTFELKRHEEYVLNLQEMLRVNTVEVAARNKIKCVEELLEHFFIEVWDGALR